MDKVNPFRRSIVFTWILFWINIYFMVFEGRAVINEVALIWSTNAHQFFLICYQIYNVQKEFLDILNIRLFHVKKVKN